MQNLISQAARFAQQSHLGQLRKYTEEPYIIHPGRVAAQVSIHPVATDIMIAAAWLHDTIEDCGVSYLDLDKRFGRNLADLVLELTNPSKKHPNLNRKERKRIDLLHISHASREAKIIKLADRIDNLLDIPLTDANARDFIKNCYLQESYNIYNALKDTDNYLVPNLGKILTRIGEELDVSSNWNSW